jgi:hypothetical protein
MPMDLNIKNSEHRSNKKDRAIADPAILNSMSLLDASLAKCPYDISFEFRHCVHKYDISVHFIAIL